MMAPQEPAHVAFILTARDTVRQRIRGRRRFPRSSPNRDGTPYNSTDPAEQMAQAMTGESAKYGGAFCGVDDVRPKLPEARGGLGLQPTEQHIGGVPDHVTKPPIAPITRETGGYIGPR